MRTLKASRIHLLFCGLMFASQPLLAQATSRQPASAQARDGQRDFDFEIGSWKTHLWVRPNPLTGSNSWVEFEGTSVVRPIWEGRSNLVELQADSATNHLEALSLRLYNPQSRQWSLSFSNSKSGTMGPSVFGEFKNGRGEFYGADSLDGRAIFVRFVVAVVSADSCRFEQSFSDDGGKTWELNWIAIDTRIKGKP